jgi:hypothetical protein
VIKTVDFFHRTDSIECIYLAATEANVRGYIPSYCFIGRTVDVTSQQGMLTPPRHLIRYLHIFWGVPIALHSILYLLLDFSYVLHVVIFAILYSNRSSVGSASADILAVNTCPDYSA